MERASHFPHGRLIVLAWLIPLVYQPGYEIFTFLFNDSTPWYWYDIAAYYYLQISFTLILASLVLVYKVNWQGMFGPIEWREMIPAIKLTTYILIFSIVALYALFIPLSYVFPDFVQWWIIELPGSIYYDNGQYPLIANILSFISLVVIAPLIEELAFRGLLMHRWCAKWGYTKAVLISSLLFGIAHPDPIGAAAFGIAMCVLYLKTQTLWVPIICHSFNNFVSWIFEAINLYDMGPEYIYTLEEFQSEWGYGIICGVIIVLWTSEYLKKPKSQTVWKLPAI